tara:strand:- start:47 stop:307 length:261 start_codon:yes stop_codon:yes gene_type:complete
MKMNFITKIMKKQENSKFAFNKINYILLGVGVALIIIGLFLMQGGSSENPYSSSGMFSVQRITIAPIIMVLGFILNIFAILYSPKK